MRPHKEEKSWRSFSPADAHADLGLPKLDEDALAYWRCVARLLTTLDANSIPQPSENDEGANNAFRRFVILQQVLVLLGIEDHNVSAEVQEEIAVAYWSSLVSVVPPGHDDIVEDAWALGQSEQSEASNEDDISWSDLKREVLSG